MGRLPLAQRLRPFLGPAIGLLAGGATVLATAALVDTGNPAPSPPSGPAASIVAGEPGRPVPVDERPLDLAYASDRVWSVTFNTGRLVGIGARPGVPRTTINLPGGVGTQALAAGFKSLWAVNSRTRSLSRVDPRTGRTLARIPLPPGAAVSVAAGRGAVWVGNRKTSDPASVESVLRVDPRTNTVVRTIPLDTVGDLDAGEGAVWVITGGDMVARIDASTGNISKIPVGLEPRRITVGAGYVWVSNKADNTVSQISPVNLNSSTVAVGNRPGGIATGKDTAWVANELDDTVTRIDARTKKEFGRPVPVGRNPLAVVVHGRQLWVASLAQDTITPIKF
jgi:DNA-binding beta-propeller fold protein YncE